MNTIITPAIAIVKLRKSLTLHVVITKITADYVTIFNPEKRKEETYSKDYFSGIWDGILVLINYEN